MRKIGRRSTSALVTDPWLAVIALPSRSTREAVTTTWLTAVAAPLVSVLASPAQAGVARTVASVSRPVLESVFEFMANPLGRRPRGFGPRRKEHRANAFSAARTDLSEGELRGGLRRRRRGSEAATGRQV